jgi:hypothetical protein
MSPVIEKEEILDDVVGDHLGTEQGGFGSQQLNLLQIATQRQQRTTRQVPPQCAAARAIMA